MKRLSGILLALVVAAPCMAAEPAPPEPFAATMQRAKAFHEQKKYAEAARLLETLTQAPNAIADEGWPSALYDLARNRALQGDKTGALDALQQGVDQNAGSAETLTGEADFAALRDDSRFRAMVAALQSRARLWRDNAALATAYKPRLTEDEKVAGLSKFWSEAKFNFAFFDRLPDLDWDKLYMEYLPQVRAAATTADYYRVMMRFAANLHDGHSFVLLPQQLFAAFGAHPDIETARIEGKVLVVAADPAQAPGIRTGDEIAAIDGMDVEAYVRRNIAPYVTGFTPQEQTDRAYGRMLLTGDVARPATVTLRHADGTETRAVLARKVDAAPPNVPMPLQFRISMDNSAFRRIGRIAYLDVPTMMNDSGAAQLRAHFAEVMAADGLIIDLRKNGGGNSDSGYKILAMLTDKPFATSRWRTINYRGAYRAWGNIPGWSRFPADMASPDPALHYAGPVVVLTGGHTFSAAEDFAVAFDAMRRGTIIGEPTAGSTGQPLFFALPGGGRAVICAKDDSYPDGKRFEGVGVQPQIAAAPTVATVRAGQDAVLGRAIDFLKNKR